MGYDPGLVDALRRRMREAADELAAVRSHDPQAADALAVVASVGRMLDSVWVPALTAVLASDPLGSNRRGDDRDAIEAHVTGTCRAGWLPCPPPGHPERDDTEWIALFDEFGERHLFLAGLVRDDPTNPELVAEWDHLERSIAAAATEYAAAAASGRSADGMRWFHPALLQVSPYAAALVMRHLRLDDATLALMSNLVVRRARSGGPEPGTRWPDHAASTDRTADIVFALLTTRPEAATAFLLRVSPDELLRSAWSSERVRDLLMVGTAPERVDEQTAGEILRPLLEFLWTAHVPHTIEHVQLGIPAAVAPAVAPWLLDLGARAEHWGWTHADGTRSLRHLLADHGTVAALTPAMSAWRSRIGQIRFLDDEGRLATDVVDELATMFVQVDLAMRDAEVDIAEREAFLVDAVAMTVGNLVVPLVPGGPATKVAADKAADVAPELVTSLLGRWGWVTDLDQAERDAQARFGGSQALTAVVAVTAFVAQAVERGDLPAVALDRLEALALGEVRGGSGATCVAREVSDRLHRYVRELGPLASPSVAHALHAVVSTFSSPSAVEQQCR
jgi:hypothetical protein